ncbi:MAG: STAS domain-containing protein [bacterium]|nr:STAS domain-containing protein [Candidatus Sumerlaeota bacterium]
MEIKESTSGTSEVLTITGKIDVTTSGQLQDAIIAGINRGGCDFVLDLSGADYISSSGLRVLLIVIKRLKEQGGRLVIAAASGHIREVFDIAGFTPLFPMYPTIDEALAALADTQQKQ